MALQSVPWPCLQPFQKGLLHELPVLRLFLLIAAEPYQIQGLIGFKPVRPLRKEGRFGRYLARKDGAVEKIDN